MAVDKLKLTNCKIKGTDIVKNTSVSPFVVSLNPENYTITSRITYKTSENANSEIKYKDIPSDDIKFSALTLDVTGVIPGTAGNDLNELIANLKKVVCVIDGSEQETPIVKLEWGVLVRYARLTEMNVQYVLFSEAGEPLRATVDLSFSEYKTIKNIVAEQNKQSPDMTHLVEVKAGDTLPLLCSRIYNDSSYYLEVARINGLSNFRQLKAGSFLYFPPLAG